MHIDYTYTHTTHIHGTHKINIHLYTTMYLELNSKHFSIVYRIFFLQMFSGFDRYADRWVGVYCVVGACECQHLVQANRIKIQRRLLPTKSDVKLKRLRRWCFLYLVQCSTANFNQWNSLHNFKVHSCSMITRCLLFSSDFLFCSFFLRFFQASILIFDQSNMNRVNT